jgi:SpoVK/Ycf46/Vps4 family AAA+-type ATPase
MILKELMNMNARRDLAELVVPRRSFSDVILPDSTRRALSDALVEIEKHGLIFRQWGLGERHATGTGLAFNFAGPPGTGKTICAEAVARALGKRLLKVRVSEMESCWVGETGKNVTAVFREARQQDAVLFFDEADSIASRRFAGTSHGYERESNQVVNVLLNELENYPGVVIFATNLARNFDPAFERRIRTHVLFDMPGPEDREKIWQVQVHPEKTPLADDVDFAELARKYEVSGGDIKNAVLRAAQMAAAEEGADRHKAIGQRHLLAGMERVLEARRVMRQTLFGEEDASSLDGWSAALRSNERLSTVEADVIALREELLALRGELREARLAWEERLRRWTVIPLPRWAGVGLTLLALAASAGLGWASAALHWIH